MLVLRANKVWPVLLIALVCGDVAAAQMRLHVIGSAFDPAGTELLYREYHYCDAQQLRCSVEYRDATDILIADKALDYTPGPFRPSLVMRDHRRDVELTLGATASQDTVVDAGFDNFVRSRWDELAAGSTLHFPFLVPGFDDPLDMRAKQLNSGVCPGDQLCIEIALDSWLLSMLANGITVTYARDSRRLLRFTGVSNIRTPEGKSFDVDIRYEYADATEAITTGKVPVVSSQF